MCLGIMCVISMELASLLSSSGRALSKEKLHLYVYDKTYRSSPPSLVSTSTVLHICFCFHISHSQEDITVSI